MHACLQENNLTHTK